MYFFSVHEMDETIQPELTLSFVVIGNKQMFEAGYEKYLPIEKIVTHPKYNQLSADLALVFTFAGMTADKPGRIIKLAGEKISNMMDTNVTVFSWGSSKIEKNEEVFNYNYISRGEGLFGLSDI
jgi:hypothetical protein